MQRSIMGFGSLATAIYSRKMISEATLNESHGTMNPGKSNMCYFHERLDAHKQVDALCPRKGIPLTHISREQDTIEYRTMYRAVLALFRQFPDIKNNVLNANKDPKPLIEKIRKVSADGTPGTYITN